MKKILIVEDDQSISELERDYLEINGFEVTIADNGNDGLALALAEDFDLVILDIMLPGKDGFAVCRELRQVKEIPILMLSARKEDVDKIRGLGLGADDYIVKPFSPGELVARVNAHLKRFERLLSLGSSKGREEVLTVRNLRVMVKERRVFRGEKEIKLANKEFELLSFFAANPNIVFSKDVLLDRVWGLDSPGDATITVHIKRLRDKIESPGDKPEYIETVWGAGYRFNV